MGLQTLNRPVGAEAVRVGHALVVVADMFLWQTETQGPVPKNASAVPVLCSVRLSCIKGRYT